MAGRIELAVRPSSSAFLVIAVALAAVLVVGYLLFRTGGAGLQSYRLAGREQQVQQEIAELERQHEELVALREYLRSDEYIESLARRVLGLVKPGESMAVVSGSEEAGPETSTDEGSEFNEPWWKALFGP